MPKAISSVFKAVIASLEGERLGIDKTMREAILSVSKSLFPCPKSTDSTASVSKTTSSRLV